MSSTSFSLSQNEAIMTLNQVCSSLSILGELFMFYIFIKLKETRTYEFKLIISLSFADFIFSIGNIFSTVDMISPSPLCNFTGFLITSGKISSVGWAFTIIYLAVRRVRGLKPFDFKKVSVFMWIISNVASVLALICAMIFDNQILYFGDLAQFCQVVPKLFNMLTIQIPSLVLIFLTFIYYLLFINVYRKLICHGTYFNVMLYPIVLAVLWIPSEIYFSLVDVDESFDNFVLMIFCIGCSRINGLINSIVYGRQFFFVSRRNRKSELVEELKFENTKQFESFSRESEVEFERWELDQN